LLSEKALFDQKLEEKLIALVGNMGVGKTTLSTLLRLYDPTIFFPFIEPHLENPYLPGQYSAIAERREDHVVFLTQQLFLTYKTRNLLEVKLQALLLQEDQQLWLDRTIYEDAEIFAKNLFDLGHMSDEDWKRYVTEYEAALVLVPKPRMLFYLMGSPATCKIRADNDSVRNPNILPDLEYYNGLNNRYETMMREFETIQTTFPPYNRTRVIRIDTNNVNLFSLTGQNEVLYVIIDALHNEGLLSKNLSLPTEPLLLKN
jgi:deoxyadenosine/deoxycytidine kinase